VPGVFFYKEAMMKNATSGTSYGNSTGNYYICNDGKVYKVLYRQWFEPRKWKLLSDKKANRIKQEFNKYFADKVRST
jgi:hypothetical protein